MPTNYTSLIQQAITQYAGNGVIYGMDTFIVDVIELTQVGSSNISISEANHTITLQSPLRRNINMNRYLIGGSL